jgi:hypothetical protein
MTERTPREILDAIRRGMEETWRRIDERRADRAGRIQQPGQPIDDATEQDSQSRRQV